MNTCIIFYSWQSDLPNATNRGFIQKALENAAKAIRDDASIRVEPVIDRDTIGVPGAPDIAETIFAKIERSQIFLCDVSIINEDGARPTPNPNVLIELGYARKVLGVDRIIMVMNTAYGEPELLPFDLRPRRVVTYHIQKDSEDRAIERRKFEAKLKEGLRAILTELDNKLSVRDSPVVRLGEQTRSALENSLPNQTLLVNKKQPANACKLAAPTKGSPKGWLKVHKPTSIKAKSRASAGNAC